MFIIIPMIIQGRVKDLGVALYIVVEAVFREEGAARGFLSQKEKDA